MQRITRAATRYRRAYSPRTFKRAFWGKATNDDGTPKDIKYIKHTTRPKASVKSRFQPQNLEFDTSKYMVGNDPEKLEGGVRTLKNGLRVITDATFSACPVVGLFVKAGARYETKDTHGCTRLLERLAFKSHGGQSAKEVMTQIENTGANVLTSSSRDVLVYQAEVLREDVPAMLKIIADTVTNPDFLDEDMEDAKTALTNEHADKAEDPQGFLADALHNVAWPEDSIGNAVYVEPEQIAKITKEDLKNFMKERYVGSQLVVAGVGMDVDELSKIVDPLLGHLPEKTENSIETRAPVYKGGDKLVVAQPKPKELSSQEEQPKDHVLIGFPTDGFKSDDFFTLAVLNQLMGGGDSFSSGGPGKGIKSRLFRTVLHLESYIEKAESFHIGYSDVGLYGIHAASRRAANKLPDLSVIIAEKLGPLVYGVNDEELVRAKNQLKSFLFMELESRAVLFEDLGRQLIEFGKYYSAREFRERIDAVTNEDIISACKKMFARSPSIVYHAPESSLQGVQPFDKFKDYFKSVSEITVTPGN